MGLKAERTQSAILKVLSEAQTPLGAERIVEALLAAGIDFSPRTVRLHLLDLDRRGLTRLVNRRAGRSITKAGREETGRADVITKVGMVSARVDTFTYQMTFDARRGEGTVVVNTALLHPANLGPALAEIRRVLREQLGIANRVMVARAGEQIGGVVVPENYVGIGTVCSVTMNGILLHRGIPVTSRFGGLLEIRDRRPLRFVELIEYRGSTLDPLEVFIQAGMTRVRDVLRLGSGVICAGFREIPAPAVDDVQALVRQLRPLGIGGILAIGRPNQPLFGIPVADGHAGLVVVGGLNPIAAVREAGYTVRIRSLAGLEDFSRLRPIDAARAV
ncbi:MAG: NrpR regulatory domain-containing protein [bacterium]